MTDRQRRRRAISDLLDLWLERGSLWMADVRRRYGVPEISELATADVLAILAAEQVPEQVPV